ncbi:hypothetical protein [Tenacibaculum sp. M341]|uniref:hypothetical protein n=1 Tax=Tenacibaculum sp. M341 TaxID=2530339 RepID=UPI001046D37B|nr:hypothetical protein [Tenacibaculum sp. M341]TCI91369.1 hypothetical protein EYW44_10455 [Tenacibaculum sp. M341]
MKKSILNIGQIISKKEQKNIHGGNLISNGTFSCNFNVGGDPLCFPALNEYHCLVELGLEACPSSNCNSLFGC